MNNSRQGSTFFAGLLIGIVLIVVLVVFLTSTKILLAPASAANSTPYPTYTLQPTLISYTLRAELRKISDTPLIYTIRLSTIGYNPAAKISFRLYFTPDGQNPAPSYHVAFPQNRPAPIPGQGSGNQSYFSVPIDTLAAGKSFETSFQIAPTNSANPSNFWFQTGVTANYQYTSYIPVYVNDSLVWGIEPPVVTPTSTSMTTQTFTPTSTFTITPTVTATTTSIATATFTSTPSLVGTDSAPISISIGCSKTTIHGNVSANITGKMRASVFTSFSSATPLNLGSVVLNGTSYDLTIEYPKQAPNTGLLVTVGQWDDQHNQYIRPANIMSGSCIP